MLCHVHATIHMLLRAWLVLSECCKVRATYGLILWSVYLISDVVNGDWNTTFRLVNSTDPFSEYTREDAERP